MSLINIINELTVTNITKSIDFYQNIFGFTVELEDGNPLNWAQLKKDNLRLMLEDYQTASLEINSITSKSATNNLLVLSYNDPNEYQNIYHKCLEQNLRFFKEYTETDYGKIEFGIFDPDENMILLSYEK